MFRGRFEITIDDKGRINIPSRFRDTFRERYDDRLIITNFDNCLVAYPYTEWVELENKASRLSMVKREAKAFLRFFISGATECAMDKQGRILIPPVLREYAALEKEIIVAGMLNKIEIWSRVRWEEELKISQDNFDDMAEVLSELGI
ncbi:MAG: division/cell wall cluster transcriptional repressor MraZ [Deltaproteobacteria bacterium]|nr:division/cell wall cluster transcriptional repressor MraZ [Deltaproteobacteria bacterium]